MRPEARRLAVLDGEHLSAQTFGDRSLERELLALFDGQCARLLPVLADAPEIDGVQAAHTLKGAAGAIGAFRVASLCGAVETALGEGRSRPLVARLLRSLAGAVDEARRAANARSA